MKMLKGKMPNNVFLSLKYIERQRDFLDENICGARYRDEKSSDFCNFRAQNANNSNHFSQDRYQNYHTEEEPTPTGRTHAHTVQNS